MTRAMAWDVVDGFFEDLRSSGRANLKHEAFCKTLCSPSPFNCVSKPAASCSIRVWPDTDDGPLAEGITVSRDFVLNIMVYHTLEVEGNILELCNVDREKLCARPTI